MSEKVNKKSTGHLFSGGEVLAVYGEEESVRTADPLFRILTKHKPPQPTNTNQATGNMR